MKLKYLIFIILSVSFSFAQCSLSGNIELVALDNNYTYSPYNYNPIFREGDSLYIKNITITNNGNETIYNISLDIDLILPSKEKLWFYSSKSNQLISKLEPNETHVYTTTNPWLYSIGVLSYQQLLKETGPYEIRHNLEYFWYEGVGCGHTIMINNGLTSANSLVILVKSLTELQALDEAKSSALAAWTAVRLTIFFGIVGWIVAWWVSKENLKKQHQLELIKTSEIFESVIFEINKNITVIDDLLSSKEDILKGNTIYFSRFSIFCLDNLLTYKSNYITPGVFKNLIEIRNLFRVLNDQLDSYNKNNYIKAEIGAKIITNLNQKGYIQNTKEGLEACLNHLKIENKITPLQ